MVCEETCGPLVESTQEESFSLKREFHNDRLINQRFHPREKTALKNRICKPVKKTHHCRTYLHKVESVTAKPGKALAVSSRISRSNSYGKTRVRFTQPMLTVQRWFSERPVDPSRSGSTSCPTQEASAGDNFVEPRYVIGNSFQGRLGNTKGLRWRLRRKSKARSFSDRPQACLSGISKAAQFVFW